MPAIVQVLDPWAINRGISPREARLDLAALLMPGTLTDPTVVRQGILPGRAGATQLGVAPTSPTATMAVVVAGGAGVISRAGQGPYICAVDAATTLTVATADAINPRIDIVVLRIYDLDLGDVVPAGITLPAGQRGLATLEVVPGTPNGSPGVPGTPANSIKLADVSVPANAASITAANITAHRTAAALRGAVRMMMEDDLTSGDPGIYDGELRWASSSALPLQAFSVAAGQWRSIAGGATYQVTSVTALSGQTAVGSIAGLSIPDPGVRYVLQASAYAEVTSTNGATATRADLHIRLDSASGAVIALGVGKEQAQQAVVTYTGQSAELTGAHSVLLLITKAYGDGTWGSSPNGALSVRMHPVP